MLLDSLRIEAFRGIRNSIDVPLNASITVLLAANGTAKTSVCDAAEWLLTGRVRRLQPGIISAATIQNRYAGDRLALVRAMAHWGNVSCKIERTEPETIQIPIASGGTPKPISTAKFLEQNTPSYVGQTSRTRNVEEPRAEWLRAVRFFSPDGLSLLLDDGEDAERVRSIAFAELLGVGPVGRRIEGLKGVRTQIDSPRTAIANLVEKIATLEVRAKAEQVTVSGPHLKRSDELLREVAEFCNLTLPEKITTQREVLLVLLDRLASTDRALASQRGEYIKVKSYFPQYEAALAVWKKWLEKDKPDFEKNLLTEQNEIDELNRELRNLTTISSDLTNRSGQLNVLLGQAQTVVALVRLDASSNDLPANLGVAQVRAERDKAEKNEKDALTELERWKYFVSEFAQGQRASLQLAIFEKNRLELSQSTPSAEDQESVERRLRETNLSLTQLRQQLNTSTDRWQRWGAEVKAQATNWTKQSTCPLCGYNHQSPAQLRSAIDDVLSRQPSADTDTASRGLLVRLFTVPINLALIQPPGIKHLLELCDVKRLLAPPTHVPLLQDQMHNTAIVQCTGLRFRDLQHIPEEELEPALKPAVQP